MITSLSIAVKHRFPAIWRCVEKANGLLVKLIYGKRITAAGTFVNNSGGEFTIVTEKEIPALSRFLCGMTAERRKYFNPHPFDEASLKSMLHNGSFLMIATKAGEEISGYCFLRFFFNGKAFFGLTVGERHAGLGLGTRMWAMGAEAASRAGFRLFATISESNTPSLRSCARGCGMEKVETLPGGYILVRCRPVSNQSSR